METDQEYTYRGYQIKFWIGTTKSRYYIYKDGQFLLKGEETAGINIHHNGLLRKAEIAVEQEIAKATVKRRMSKFGYPWNNIN